jgi:hypothetical protein
MNGAFNRGPLALEKAVLAGGELNGAFNAIDVSLPRPRGTVELVLRGAFNSYTVTVPEGVQVSLEAISFPLNYVSDGPATERWVEDEPGYRIKYEGAFSYVALEEGPPLPPREDRVSGTDSEAPSQAEDGPAAY